MFWAIVRKDMGLLRTYLRMAFLATLLCYVISGILTVVTSGYLDEASRRLLPRTFGTLQGGSNIGYAIAAFFAAMIAGSVFTLERSDRSAEFLACLPPTRKQNLASKLIVAIGATLAMVVVHVTAYAVAAWIAPLVLQKGGLFQESPLPDVLGVVTFISVVTAMLGGALAAGAWAKSNGGPILCGLLTPLLILSLLRTITWALEIPSWGDSFRVRVVTSMFVLGLALGTSGSYWYVMRSEP